MGIGFWLQIIIGGVVGLAAAYGALHFFGLLPDNRRPVVPPAAPKTRVEERTDRSAPKASPPPPPMRADVIEPPSRAKAGNPLPASTARGFPQQPTVTPKSYVPPSAKPKSDPAAATSPASSGLSGLPKQIDLPAVVNTDAITIAQFKSDPGTLDCSLLSGAADVPDSALYFTETIEGPSGAWYLSFTPDDKATPPEVIKIAHLVASSQELTFQWAKTTGIESIKNQLRNCLLRLRVGQNEQAIQLRKASAAGAQKLNLEEDQTVLTFDVSDFPQGKRGLCGARPT